MTDKQLKEKWLKTLTASPSKLVAMIVERHLKISRHLHIQMAVWMNPGQDPWEKGVELVEICGNLAGASAYDFRPVEFGPQSGWPRLKVIMTDTKELVSNVEIEGVRKSFASQIKRVLAAHPQKSLIYPKAHVSQDAFSKLVGGVV